MDDEATTDSVSTFEHVDKDEGEDETYISDSVRGSSCAEGTGIDLDQS